MDTSYPETLPDLILNACPLGCNQDCAIIWTNRTIGHRIVCKCKCHHNKRQVALASVGKHAPNAINESTQEENLG